MYGSIDAIVLTGSQKQYSVRLIAKPVGEETANVRRMKAKKESHGKKPSKELLKLLSWNILVTTMTNQEITYEILCELYGLRWRIENIFKTWKSSFNFNKIHNVSEHQLKVLITARLIMITIFHHKLFNHLAVKVNTVSNKVLSMMKFMRYIRKNLDIIAKIMDKKNISENALVIITRFCSYDVRKRNHFEMNFDQIMTSCNNNAKL